MSVAGGRSTDQCAMVDALDALCRAHVTPDYVKRCDAAESYPREAMAALAEAGWGGLPVDEWHGGAGGSATDLVVVHETLARHSLAVAQAYYSLWVLGAELLGRVGTQAQRAEWLPRLAAGEANIAFALTEPGSGSDAAALRTRAVREDGCYRVNGQKVFITGAAVADRIVTAVRTTPSERRQDGLSLLLIDPRSEGVTVRPLSKLGLKAIDLCEVFFDDVSVPAEDLIGEPDDGWHTLSLGLAKERLLLGAICVGAMRDVLTQATAHAKEREAFGHPIGQFQMVAEKLVRMRVAADAAELLVMRAAELLDAGQPADVEASTAKLFATEAYVSATRAGTQVFGGYGFTNDYPVARHYRDAKYLEIGGGTSEMQIVIIARSMGLRC
ncbi:MAG TPA: acyl-CoA dehydrogenase family protein [Solirubrobacteraceae bacterium]|nr:acyl-CoA dehydrogenase family protein [Solirubrobacteraceae bacterium]